MYIIMYQFVVITKGSSQREVFLSTCDGKGRTILTHRYHESRNAHSLQNQSYSVEDFEKFLAKYNNGLIFQIPMSSEQIQRMKQLFDDGDLDYHKKLVASILNKVAVQHDLKPAIINPDVASVQSPDSLKKRFNSDYIKGYSLLGGYTGRHLRPAPRGYANPKAYRKLRFGLQSAGFTIGVTVLYGVSLLLPSVMPWSSPILCSLYIGAYIHLLGMAYAIISCRLDIDHVFKEIPEGIINTFDDDHAHGIAWGVLAANPLALVLGSIFTITNLIFFYQGLVLSMSLLMLMPILVTAVLLAVRLYAKTSKDAYDGYFKAQTVGYLILPIMAISSLIALICLGKFHISITLPFYAQMASAFLPAIFVALSIMYLKYRVHHIAKSIERREGWRASGIDPEIAYKKDLTQITYKLAASGDEHGKQGLPLSNDGSDSACMDSANFKHKIGSVTLALIPSGVSAMLICGLVKTAPWQDITGIGQVSISQWELYIITFLALCLSAKAVYHAYNSCCAPSVHVSLSCN